MKTQSTLLGGAALGVLLAASLTAAADAKTSKHHHAAAGHSDLESKVDSLTATVSDLEQRLNDATAAQQATERRAEAAESKADAAEADAQAAHEQLQTQIATIPGEVETAIASNKPKTDKVYYRGVTIALNGFAAAESVYRSKNEIADIGSNYSKIPFANNAVGHTQELRFSARQSRVGFLAQGKANEDTTLSFYGEFDFLGAAQTANSNESNSYNLRIRHVYGTADWVNEGVSFLAGQTWSLVTMNGKGITPRNEIIPATIDAQYVPGFAWARQPQLRLTKNFDSTVWLAVSLENPQTTLSGSADSGVTATTQGAGAVITGTSGNINGSAGSASDALFNSLNAYSLNRYPDLVAKAAFEPDFGGGARPLHLEVFGLWSDYYDRIKVASGNAGGFPVGVSNADSTGGAVGAGATFTAVPKVLDLQASFMTGSGIGRYGSGQLPDATLMPDGKIQPIPETLWLVGGTVHANPNLDVYAYYGDETESARAYNPTVGGGHFGYGNPYFANAGCVSDTASGTCTANVKSIDQFAVGLWDKVYNGSFGNFRVGLQYSHTDLKAFAGENASSVPGSYAPKTSDDMIFTSFRYYPF